MKVSQAFIADYANVAAEGKLNILGVFQTVRSDQFPFQLPQMHLVITFEVDPSEVGKPRRIEIAFRDADAKNILSMSGEMMFGRPDPPLPGPIAANQILALNGVVFPKAGDYQFVISVDGDVKQTISLRATERPKPKS